MNPSMNQPSSLPKSPANSPKNSTEQTVNPPESPNPPNSEASTADTALATPEDIGRAQPIPPPSEPLQYRAIGLVAGRYLPSVEGFTQGMLLATDNTFIDAVLLGRVMSLVKNHLNLDEPHLWVVYPRTRKEDNKLHVQIMGVWEPENLSQHPFPGFSSSSDTTSTSVKESPQPLEVSKAIDGYFSIRGEVVYQLREEEQVFIKILQTPRKNEEEPRFFKLKLKCSLPDKMVGHFWDFQVQRVGDDLVVMEGQDIAVLRVKKKKPFKGKKPGKKSSYQSKGDKSPTTAPAQRSAPLPKPVKKPGSPK